MGSNNMGFIINDIMKAYKFRNTLLLGEFLDRYDISTLELGAIKNAKDKLCKMRDEIIIPDWESSAKVPTPKFHPVTGQFLSQSWRTVYHYPDGLKEEEINKRRRNKDGFERCIEIIEGIEKIVKMYSTDPVSGTGKSETKSNHKTKRDTKPKVNFVELFIKESKKHEMTTNKEIAKFTNVSQAWITRHFTIDFLEELYKRMNKEYSAISRSGDDIEIFADNFTLFKSRIEDKRAKVDFENKKRVLKELKQDK
jgi:hypothetical protein